MITFVHKCANMVKFNWNYDVKWKPDSELSDASYYIDYGDNAEY